MKGKRPPLSDYMDADRPRTARQAARERERLLRQKMRELLSLRDESVLREALRQDFEIDEKDPRFIEILRIWREQQ